MAKLKLTAEKIAQLAKYMEMGAPMKDIFAASGVTRSTYYRWMSIGQALDEGYLEHPDIPKQPTRKEDESDRKYNRRVRRQEEGLKVYVTLYEKMRTTPASVNIEMQLAIRSAALDGDWRAALAFLERRDPDNWNLKRILRNLAAAETQQQSQHPDTAPDMVDLIRILEQHERRLSNELEDNIRGRTQNGAESQPKAE